MFVPLFGMANFTIVRKTKTKVDQYKVLIAIMCMMNDVTLSDTQMQVLAYFMYYGINDKTDQFIMESGLFKNIAQLRNVKTKLLDKGFLVREDMYKTYKLNMDPEKLAKIPDILELKVLIDNR